MTELERSNSLPVLAARIRAEHEAAESDMRETVQHALTCGRWLLEAKAHPELKHGQGSSRANSPGKPKVCE